MNDEDEVKRYLKTIGGMLKEEIPSDVCFVLFIYKQSRREAFYVSNGNRADVLNALDEWLVKTSGALNVGKNEKKAKTPEHIDSRLELERKCAEIGKVIAGAAKLSLFLFSFGENGSAAYYTNEPSARKNIAAWIKQRRSLS
jgi:hypothetical protein